MKLRSKLALAIAALLCIPLLAACDLGTAQTQATNASSVHKISLSFSGPSVSPATTYASWVEDESGNNIADLYVCERIAKKTLTGDALPYWSTVKKVASRQLDAVTGPSVQGNVGLNLHRTIDFGSARKFRVCFEIDRSLNANAYFGDRPCFIYRSPLIDLSSPGSNPHALALSAWMSNDTTGTYGQSPNTGVSIPGFATYKLMTDFSYIADASNSLADMVTSLSVSLD